MATLSAAAQTAALQAILDLLNVGTTHPSPTLGLVRTGPAVMFSGPLGSGNIWEIVGGVMQLISAPLDIPITSGGTLLSAATALSVGNRNAGAGLIRMNPVTELSLVTISALTGQKFRISAFDVTIG